MSREEIALLTRIYQNFNISHKTDFNFLEKYQERFKVNDESLKHLFKNLLEKGLIRDIELTSDEKDGDITPVIKNSDKQVVTLDGLITINRVITAD